MKYPIMFCACLAISYTSHCQNTSPWPSTGNIGIGTTTPDFLLQLHSSNVPTLAIGKGNSITNGQSSLLFNAGIVGAFNGFWINYFKTASADRLGFVDGGAVERMSILNGGKVGIGTTTPAFNLDVSGNLRTTSFISANEYITVQNGGSYRVALNGQSDGYVTGRDAANQDKFLISSNGNSYFNGGNVGIGTLAPAFKLDVAGNLRTTSFINAREYITVDNGGSYRVALNGQSDGYVTGRDVTSQDKFLISANGNSYFNGGNVGIGTTNPQQKLHVKGTVYSTEVKVDLAAGTGPDYVFSSNYQLPTLNDVKTYIDQHKHLPEVPSAKEMEANGVNLGEMNMLLLKKIEELTLYMIDMKKENEVQQREIEALKKGKN